MPVYTYTIISNDILHIHAPVTISSIPVGYRPYAMLADLLDASGTRIDDNHRNDLGFIAVPNNNEHQKIIALRGDKDIPSRFLLESDNGFPKSSKITIYKIEPNDLIPQGAKLIVGR